MLKFGEMPLSRFSIPIGRNSITCVALAPSGTRNIEAKPRRNRSRVAFIASDPVAEISHRRAAVDGAGTPKINATVSALRFFFKVTLDRSDLAKHLSFMQSHARYRLF